MGEWLMVNGIEMGFWCWVAPSTPFNLTKEKLKKLKKLKCNIKNCKAFNPHQPDIRKAWST
jgi:hypothetical protein